jgi:HlyD family secretion protein
MYVHSGQKIVELSPDGDLVAECYIAPKDIGFIRKSQNCNIQIDAYNYNQWGMLTGHVKEIFKDVQYSNEGGQQYSYYLIYCEIDSDRLSLKNGYEGVVKKGMTLTSRMIVTERTIAQLLYDKVDNWLNPNLMD